MKNNCIAEKPTFDNMTHAYCMLDNYGYKHKLRMCNHKVRHPRCVYNKLDWSVYTWLTQLYGGTDMSSVADY